MRILDFAVEHVTAILLADGTWHDVVKGTLRVGAIQFGPLASCAERTGASWAESDSADEELTFAMTSAILAFRTDAGGGKP